MIRTSRRSIRPTVLLASVLLWIGLSAEVAAAQDCRALADLKIQDTNLLSAAVVEADDELPEYCRVLGFVRPAINFEIRLPTSDWNGKFYMAGVGGFGGRIEADQGGFFNSGTYGLKRNYAVSKTDGGHWGSWLDGTWAYHNRQAEIDYGHRAVHETARVTKEIIAAYYGNGPEYSYFQGCSNGGRQALMEVQRYPEDFDGVLAGAPAHYLTDLYAHLTQIAHASAGPGGRRILTDAALSSIRNAVYETCDGVDGLDDGLLSDPRTCRFDFSTLLCESSDSNDCLSSAQVAAAEAMYKGPSTSDGRPLYPGGVPLGAEAYWGWIHNSIPDRARGPLPTLAEQFMRYVAFLDDPGEAFDIDDFDFDRHPPQIEFMSGILDAKDPDLRAFREGGGKLLIWHGGADVAIPPEGSIEYYEAVESLLGDREATQDFFQLYMIPGMDHCGIGADPGIDQHGFDPLTALERWVEKEEPPRSLLMTKSDSTGAVEWTRPACPYPQRAVYDGDGDVDEASSFTCAAP